MPNILVVNPQVPAKDLAELIAYAKANPGQLNFSSPGAGSGAHLAGELLKSSAGIDIVHVPYNGIAPAVTAVVAGDVQMMFAAAPSALPQVSAAASLRALARREPEAHRRRAGAADARRVGIARLRRHVVVQHRRARRHAAGRHRAPAEGNRPARSTAPTCKAKLAGLGAEPVANSPAEFAAMIKIETAKWGKIVKDANIRAGMTGP